MPDTDRPNILWICTDQQRFDTIAALGNPHIRTPNIDRLARDGVAFTHAYCQSPICTPSRASFLTGMYPSSVHGCTNGNECWAEAAPLVTKLLADAGYDCGLVGKLHLAGAADRVEPRPLNDGYRVFEWCHEPRDMWPEGDAYRDWLADQGFDLSELVKEPSQIPPELHQTAWCADRAIAFMSEERQSPWLMSVNIFDPHSPFNPPQEYLDRYIDANLPAPHFRPSDLTAQEQLSAVDFQNPARDPDSFDIRAITAAYYAMIELIDHNVGRMMEALHGERPRRQHDCYLHERPRRNAWRPRAFAQRLPLLRWTGARAAHYLLARPLRTGPARGRPGRTGRLGPDVS